MALEIASLTVFNANDMSPAPPAISKNACPVCGAFAGHKPVIRVRETHDFITLFFGGVPGLALMIAGRAKRVKCNACGATFNIRPTSSKIYL
jgi:hypothetical protein